MINRQSRQLEMVHDNVRRKSNTINYNTVLPKKKVLEVFEDMLPVFDIGKVVPTHMKVKKLNGTKNGINGQGWG